MSPPELSTGCAAPMFVAGAIAAMVPAIVMNVPAEAARAPDGATNVTTGTGALRNAVVMRYVESMSPPGVLMTKTTAGAPAACASAMTRST